MDGLPRGGIYADGNLVYIVAVAEGVQIFDVTIPSSPVNIGNCPLDPNSLAWTSAKSGDYIFAALSDGGLAIVDVSVPQYPFVAGTYYDIVYGVGVSDDLVYVVSYSYGLNILDISDLSNITVTGTCAVPGFPYRVQIVGSYAYVGNTDYSGAGGVNVVDVSDPANPSLVTSYVGFAEHIAAAGNTLAFTGSNMACSVLDISTPTAPVLASTYSIPNFIGDIYVDGNYAYTGNNGFRIFDITDKTNPVQVGYNITDGSIVRTAGNHAVYIRESMSSNSWTSGGIPGETFCYAQALEVEGNYLYIIDYGPFTEEDTKGLYIMDISDILNPVLVTRFTGIASYGYDLDVVGNMVYIADNYGGVEVIDVTDKNNPVVRGYCSLPDGANSVMVTENMAFVADYINGGVQVVDVTNPDNPIVAGYYKRSGCFALAVDVKGTNIYLADGAGGFQIYTTTLITGTKNNPGPADAASTSYPNPFSDQLTITAQTTAESGNYLRIYNSAGTLVATLFPSEYHQGETVYRWNGKSASGANVSPGFYFYKSSAGDVCGKMIKSDK